MRREMLLGFMTLATLSTWTCGADLLRDTRQREQSRQKLFEADEKVALERMKQRKWMESPDGQHVIARLCSPPPGDKRDETLLQAMDKHRLILQEQVPNKEAAAAALAKGYAIIDCEKNSVTTG